MDWNVENGQQGKNVMPSMLREEINAVFQKKNVFDIEKDKNSKILGFSPFLLNFCQTIHRRRGLECKNA